MRNRVSLIWIMQHICVAMLPIIATGCGNKDPSTEARERLRKQYVAFMAADARMPFANIPAATTGHLVATVPFNTGSGGGWTDADFKGAVEDLRRIPELDYLILRLTWITDFAMQDLASVKQLRHINLGMMHITDDGLAPLSALHNLEGIYFDGSENITGLGLRFLHTESVTKLSLRGTKASDKTTMVLKEFNRLEHLDLGLSGIGDETLRTVATLSWLRTLLIDRTDVTDDGVSELLHCQRLERLILSLCPQIRKVETVRKLCRLPNLVILDLSGTGIDELAIAALRKEFSRVKIEWSFGEQK